MSALNKTIQSFVENDQLEKEEIKSNENLNAKQKKEIEIEDFEEMPCDSEENYEDSYDEEDIFTEEDSMSGEDYCPSDFEEWMTMNQRRTRLKNKVKCKSHSD